MEILRWLAYNVLPVVASIAISVTYIPQIIKTYKVKSVGDISIMFWVLLNVFLGSMFVISLVTFIDTGEWGMLLTQSSNWILALIQFGQIIYYKWFYTGGKIFIDDEWENGY